MSSKRRKSIPKLFYRVKLKGAKDPYNVITITVDPKATVRRKFPTPCIITTLPLTYSYNIW